MKKQRYFLEVTSGHGPEECRLLAARVARWLYSGLSEKGVTICPVDICGDWEGDSIRSVLFEVSGDRVEQLTDPLLGTVQWTAVSPFRPHHKRRNWFAGIRRFQADPELAFRLDDVEISSCRGSGPGGQHVNTTDSRIQALHRPTGVRAEAGEERSQHRNRQLALVRLAAKLSELNAAGLSRLDTEVWRSHQELERGNPVIVIRGKELWRFDK